MRLNKKAAALLAIPAALGGWALFRPELLFVNQTVDEKLVTTPATVKLTSGTFTSQAHETTGTAEILDLGKERVLRLTDFHTSNGPDVRVYLIKKDGSRVGLGALKGNIGDQNYAIPAEHDPADIQEVSIWCERFAVGFGIAKLEPANPSATKTSSIRQQTSAGAVTATWSPAFGEGGFQLASFGAPIEVTFGTLRGDARFQGRAAIVEDAGKRWVALDLTKVPSGKFELRLAKKETLSLGGFPANTPFVSLGALTKGKSNVQVGKDLDLWLYRSIAVLDANTSRVIATVNLRSAQEKNRVDLA